MCKNSVKKANFSTSFELDDYIIGNYYWILVCRYGVYPTLGGSGIDAPENPERLQEMARSLLMDAWATDTLPFY